jgi:hypothetical protein
MFLNIVDTQRFVAAAFPFTRLSAPGGALQHTLTGVSSGELTVRANAVPGAGIQKK